MMADRQAVPEYVFDVVKLAPGVPETEFSFRFVQGMANRMSVSYFKYGACPDAYPDKVDAVASLEARLRLYKEGGTARDGSVIPPGNPAYLVDVGNFAMIEYRYPRHAGRETFDHADSDVNSPGRARLDNAAADATNDGLSQENRAAQSHHESKLESARVYKRQGD